MTGEERLPYIGLQLFHAQSQTALIGLNGQHNCLYAAALFEYLGRMLHALGPTQTADVHQAVDAIFDLDESAEGGQGADTSFDRHSDGECPVPLVPGLEG